MVGCRNFLALFFLVLSVSFAKLEAQVERFPYSHYLGLKGGAVASRYDFVPSVPEKQHFSWGAGLLYRLDVESYASLVVELNYLHTGWSEDYEDKSAIYDRHIHSINLPLFTNLHYDLGPVRFYLNAGPIIGYVFSESWNVEGNRFNAWAKLRHNMPIANKFFWGLGGGPGLSFCIAKRHFLEIEGRYTAGLGNIWPNARKDPYGLSAERRIELALNYLVRF